MVYNKTILHYYGLMANPTSNSEGSEFTKTRVTRYTAAIQGLIATKGHVTNAEILDSLKISNPDISATTVHRITTRLVERGIVRLAPSSSKNERRFDANLQAHDHFNCLGCGMLRDADIKHSILPILETAIGGGCSISGRIVISGYCKNCKHLEP